MGAQKMQRQKKCKTTGQLRAVVKALRDLQCISKPMAQELSSALGERSMTITSEVGQLEQKGFGSHEQLTAVRKLNAVIDEFEARKTEQVQSQEATAAEAS